MNEILTTFKHTQLTPVVNMERTQVTLSNTGGILFGSAYLVLK